MVYISFPLFLFLVAAAYGMYLLGRSTMLDDIKQGKVRLDGNRYLKRR